MSGCPLVMVEWEDSAQPISAWVHLEDYEPAGIVRCVSVGWLIKDDDEMKVVAPNMGSIDRPANLQVSGVIQIPTRCVTKLTKLKEPRPNA